MLKNDKEDALALIKIRVDAIIKDLCSAIEKFQDAKKEESKNEM